MPLIAILFTTQSKKADETIARERAVEQYANKMP
jgi:hypothetical protein